MANTLIQHQRLVEDTDVCSNRDVAVELENTVGEGSQDLMVSQRMVDSNNTIEYAEEHKFCWGLCCMQGCIMGVVAMIYFFVVLPTGVMLVFHGVSKRRSLTLNLGIGVLCVPTVILIAIILLGKYCRLKRKDERIARNTKKKIMSFENPLSRRHGEDDICSSMC